VQFSYRAGSCGVSGGFRLGYADGERGKGRDKMSSGWMMERVDDLFRKLEERCGVRDWFGPQDDSNTELKMKMRRKRTV